jgi:hypothetical protein
MIFSCVIIFSVLFNFFTSFMRAAFYRDLIDLPLIFFRPYFPYFPYIVIWRENDIILRIILKFVRIKVD